MADGRGVCRRACGVSRPSPVGGHAHRYRGDGVCTDNTDVGTGDCSKHDIVCCVNTD